MSQEWDSLSSQTQQTLNEILQRVGAEWPDAEWPAIEEIWAFTKGAADETTTQKVQSALARSSELREYVVDLSGLDQPLSEAEQQELQKLSIPDSSQLAEQLGIGEAKDTPNLDSAPSLWDQIRGLFWQPRTAYALVAIQAVLLLMPRGGAQLIRPVQSLNMIATNGAQTLRGGDTQVGELPAGEVAITIWLPVEAAPAEGAAYRLEVTHNEATVAEQPLPLPSRLEGSWASVVTIDPAALPGGELIFTVVRELPGEDALTFLVRLQN